MNPEIKATIRQLQAYRMPTVVKSIEQMRYENSLKAAEKRRDEIEAMTTDELIEQMKVDMPLSETLKSFRDHLIQYRPNASVVMFGLEPGGKDTNIIAFEQCGIEELQWQAFNRSMHSCQHAIRLFNHALLLFVDSVSKEEAETQITVLQDLIRDLQKRNSYNAQINLKQAEIKRLKKAGRVDLAELKQKEIEQLKEQKRREDEEKKRKEAIREKNIANLAKARKVQAEKRAKAKNRKKNQQQQPNFAKMAKQKRQQIAARQAEKKKRKAASGNEFSTTKSCSQLLIK